MIWSWKAALQIRDLETTSRIEVECKTCGHFRYEEAAKWKAHQYYRQLCLDEFENHLKCHMWGCGKSVRIALPSSIETEGFQGGLA